MFVTRNDVKSIKDYFQSRLKEQFSNTEIKLIVRECVCRRLGLSFSDYLLSDTHRLSESDLLYFRSVVKRLLQNEPFQYIIGNVTFCGIDLKVGPGVLIPRPETEELVDWIIHEFKGQESLFFLDVCAGSGCISFGLEKGLRGSDISAWELSSDALNILQQNKQILNSSVKFYQADVLAASSWDAIKNETIDVLVSNPPYIPEVEREEMGSNVLEHEPSLALFVPDNDPLVFYRNIIDHGLQKLKSGGKIFFEINSRFSREVIELLEQRNLVNIVLRKDLQGKDRMLMAQKP